MSGVIILFLTHWYIAAFFQSFFMHRYAAHRMFTMNKGWERTFQFMTYLTQGAFFLSARSYAISHREHHAYADTMRDPHSPNNHKNIFDMMFYTKRRYDALTDGTGELEKRFSDYAPQWAMIDNLFQNWLIRLGIAGIYFLFYLHFAAEGWMFMLLPFHLLMNPLQRAILNWCGHYIGYRNFVNGDDSMNVLPFDILMLGEFYQNNHHKFGSRINFGLKWFEIDLSYMLIAAFRKLGMVTFNDHQNTLVCEQNRHQPTKHPTPNT